MRKNIFLLSILLILLSSYPIFSQDPIGYQTPPTAMSDLLLAKPTPSVSIDDKAHWMLLIERNSYPTVEELGQPEARIAGLRINPANFSPSRQNYINNFILKDIRQNNQIQVKGLPIGLLAGQPT